MKRIKVLLGQRRFQVLVTMALLLLAVSVVIGSGANFTATSANPGNVFTAGALSIGNFKSDGSTPNGGSLIENLTASNMKPTDSISGTARDQEHWHCLRHVHADGRSRGRIRPDLCAAFCTSRS